MTSREIVRRIVGLEPAPRCGFWLGNPHPESWAGLHRYFGTKTEEELRRKLGDDYRWISPSLVASTFPTPGVEGDLLELGRGQDEPRPGRPAGRGRGSRPSSTASIGRTRAGSTFRRH